MSIRLQDDIVTVTSAPVGQADRIQDIDVIRGFALFGVVWMNLFETTRAFMPETAQAALPSAPLDRVVAFLGEWLVLGKAQCLFGVLFGIGFALFTDRVLQRGGNAGRVYARRLAFLLVLGLLHLMFLWFGDILHDYALVGFLLLLTRKLPTQALLVGGAVLLLGSEEAVSLLTAHIALPHVSLSRHVEGGYLHAEMWRALSQGDYATLLQVGLLRAARTYGNLDVLKLWAPIAGQFLLGTWIYRKGWLQESRRHASLMRRVAVTLLPVGLLLSMAGPVAGWAPRPGIGEVTTHLAEGLATPMLALGYAAALIVLCRVWTESAMLGGLAAFGRMALTNYVSQSMFYFLVVDGFGLGMIRRSGAAMDLLMAVGLVVLQVAVSQWWLRSFRFGPLEWLWRSATYGTWQRLRGAA